MSDLRHGVWLKKLKLGVWMKPSELDALWALEPSTRKYRVHQLVKAGLLERKGQTSDTQYRLSPEGKEVSDSVAPLNDDPVGVLTSLSSPLPLPKKVTPLRGLMRSAQGPIDELIEAASKVGAENEKYRRTLGNIRNLIDAVLEELA